MIGGTRNSAYDAIALHLARGFHSSELPYALCDAIVNDLFGIITSTGSEWPELFFEVYCAFDAGEYYHRDRPTEDPVELYTRPMISKIVAAYSESN